MRITVLKVLFAALALRLLTSILFAQQPPPDLILFNGKVFTSNSSRPYVEALAIRGERIAGVGSSKDIAGLAGKETKLIDLGGRTVIPGINDAHVHLGADPSHYDLPLNGDDPTYAPPLNHAFLTRFADLTKRVIHPRRRFVIPTHDSDPRNHLVINILQTFPIAIAWSLHNNRPTLWHLMMLEPKDLDRRCSSDVSATPCGTGVEYWCLASTSKHSHL